MLGTKKKPLVYVVTVAVGLVLVWSILNGRPAAKAKPIRLVPVPVVEAISVRAQRHQLSISTQGVVQPKIKINLVSQVSGRIDSVAEQFVSGGRFAANDALVTVEDADYRIAVQQAQATLADAAALLAEEKGRGRQAAREWRDLGAREANELFLRKPQLASAEAKLLAAEAKLEQAQLDLARTRISAPFSGRVLSKSADLGQFVNVGSSVAEVYSTEVAEVRLPLTARQRQHVSVTTGLQIPVKLIAQYGDKEYIWQATINRLEGAVDSESRQYYAVASILNPFVDVTEVNVRANVGPDNVASNNAAFNRENTKGEALTVIKPALAVGQFIKAKIAGDWIDNSFLIPRNALRQPQRLWLVAEDNTLVHVAVDVIQSDDQFALVVARKFSKGEGNSDFQINSEKEILLVVSDLALALNGMKINVLSSDLSVSKSSSAQSSR